MPRDSASRQAFYSFPTGTKDMNAEEPRASARENDWQISDKAHHTSTQPGDSVLVVQPYVHSSEVLPLRISRCLQRSSKCYCFTLCLESPVFPVTRSARGLSWWWVSTRGAGPRRIRPLGSLPGLSGVFRRSRLHGSRCFSSAPAGSGSLLACRPRLHGIGDKCWW